MIRSVCLDCRTLTTDGSRCAACQARRDALYKGDYAARARKVRASATVCWICGQGARVGDPWSADHYVPSDPASPLLPSHRSCNSRRGNRTATH